MSSGRPTSDDYSQGTDDTERFSADHSPPWYLKRSVLALWGLAVVILITAIIYGLAILARGNGGGAPAPTTTTTPTTTSSRITSTTEPTTTPSTTEPTATTTEPVPSSAPRTPQHPRRHWWRSNLPPVPHI